MTTTTRVFLLARLRWSNVEPLVFYYFFSDKFDSCKSGNDSLAQKQFTDGRQWRIFYEAETLSCRRHKFANLSRVS